jgi:hypothetical protein
MSITLDFIFLISYEDGRAREMSGGKLTPHDELPSAPAGRRCPAALTSNRHERKEDAGNYH